MLDISIKTVPHRKQRYCTAGDYWNGRCGKEHFRIDAMGDKRYEILVAVHELVEKTLCDQDGITVEAIDAFDKKFERDRAKGLHGLEDEPGNHPDAPYRQQHQFATQIEKMLAHRLGVDWKKYDKAVMSGADRCGHNT